MPSPGPVNRLRWGRLSELFPLRVLFSRTDGPEVDHVSAASSLLRWLRSCSRLEVRAVQGREEIRPAGHHVVIAASERTPGDAEVAALAGHLRAGGGLLLLGGTLAAWSRNPGFAELAGGRPGPAGPRTELRVRPQPGSPLAQRLDEEIRLTDRLQLAERPVEGVDPLLTVAWHFGDQVVAWLRPVGAGRLVHLGLGCLPGVFGSTAYQQLVHRCVWAAAGMDTPAALGVGLYGYGAIGREHAGSIVAVDGLELQGVCDRSPQRLADAAAHFPVSAHLESRSLLEDPRVDVVVVGVPPTLHLPAVLECLEAGKHVVCEKPFALRVDEVDRMLAAASSSRRTVTVYQSRRWDPDFLAMREAVRRGAIGDPFYLEAFIGGFGHPCSYWHSDESTSGGTIFDWGSHYFDWMLQLLTGEVVRVAATAHKRVWHDVTNADQVRVDVAFEGGEQATFLQSDVAAALKPKWYLLGTGGAVVGDWRLETVSERAWTGDLVEQRLQPAESPATVRLHRPAPGGVDVTELAIPARAVNGFYRNLADHLLLGEPLAVRAEEAKRNVAVMEAATRSAAAGGRAVELRA